MMEVCESDNELRIYGNLTRKIAAHIYMNNRISQALCICISQFERQLVLVRKHRVASSMLGKLSQ